MQKIISNGFRVSVLLMGIVSSANAALVNIDWQSSGDQLLVLDTNSSLQWLKLTETDGLRYSEVSGQLGVGGSYQGFRYANNSEIVALFTTYFLIDLSSTGYYGERAAYIDPGVRLASEALGNGVSGGTDAYSGPDANYYLFGISGDAKLDGSQFVLGAHTRWSDTDYATARDPVSIYNRVSTTDAMTGSYLVRATPIPAALWLFGAGLFALIGLGKRN